MNDADLRAHYASRPVLVTGGMGFIGSNLVRRLNELGAKVTVVDNLAPKYGGNPFNLDGVRDQIDFIQIDQGDEKNLRPVVARFENIFNLVGQVSHVDSMEDPYTDLYTNVTVHAALLEACRHGNRRPKVVFAGTRGQYGRPARTPVDEKAPIAPIDVNGINKHTGEMYHFLYASVYGLSVCSLRLTNTYGPRHTMRTGRQGVFAWFVRQALDGEPIRLFGGGEQLRDFNYVDDVVRALLLAMASPAADGHVFNLGSAEAVSLARVTELIVQKARSGSVLKVPYPEEFKKIEIGDYIGDYTKIRQVLGWEPQVALEDGIAQTVDYYQKNRDRYWMRELYP